MMKMWTVVLVLVAQSAFAERLQFSLDCTPDRGVAHVPAHIDGYRVVKSPFRREDGKWDARYSVFVTFKSSAREYEYALVPAGSGDEDYNEYDLKATSAQKKAINLQGAYIQNRFTWATLVDTDGVGFARCEKSRR